MQAKQTLEPTVSNCPESLSTMDRLCGVESLPIVYHRFSDGVEIVKCVVEFYKEMADVELSYSSSIHRLLRSSSYTFHSNILMQWLGSEPFEEIGTLKHSWQKLGSELCKLGDLHAEKATAYSDAIRKPLMDLVPELEEARKALWNRLHRLRSALEAAQKKHTREKQKYQQICDNHEKLLQKVMEVKSTATEKPSSKLRKLETRLASLATDLQNQEAVYKTAHDDLLSALDTFNKEVAEEYTKLEARELERVDALKQSLQGFARTLSNTAPAYLESMQQIVLSVDEIDGSSDIQCFVESHSDLMTAPSSPNFEKYTVGTSQGSSDADAVSNPPQCTQREGNPTEPQEEENESGEDISTDVDSEISTDSDTTESDRDGASVDQHEREKLPRPITTRDQKQASATRSLAEKQPKPGRLSDSAALARARTKEKVTDTPPLVASVVPGMETKSRERTEKVNGKTQAQSLPTAKPLLAPKPTLNVTGPSKDKHSPPPPTEPKQATKSTPVSSTIAGSTVASQQKHSRTRTSSIENGDSKGIHGSTATMNSSVSSHGQFRPKVHSFTASNASVSSSPQSKKRTLTNAGPGASGWTRKDRDERADDANPEFQMLSQLQQRAAANNYYTLLGVEAGASTDAMARARREKSKDLHPDHFGNDPDKRASAEEQLVLINQIFQDVFKSEDTRSLYEQLCLFRKVYPKTLQQKQKGLETAELKLLGLYKKMKKAQMPLPLLDEVQLALRLIKICLQKSQS